MTKPVAWMYDNGEGQLALSFIQSHARYPYWTETPLYTRPTPTAAERQEVRDFLAKEKLGQQTAQI